jgi:hypothetical protein
MCILSALLPLSFYAKMTNIPELHHEDKGSSVMYLTESVQTIVPRETCHEVIQCELAYVLLLLSDKQRQAAGVIEARRLGRDSWYKAFLDRAAACSKDSLV